MNLIGFIKGMLPHFDKDHVLEDLRITISELETVAGPSVKAAGDFFKSQKFQSDEVKNLSDVFYRNLDPNHVTRQHDMVNEIAVRLPSITTNLRFVMGLLEELLEKDVITDGLTARKAGLLRIAAGGSYLSRFTTDLLNFVYVFEAKAMGDEEADMGLAPIVVKNVESGIASFARILGALGMPPKEMEKLYEEIPEVVINEKTEKAIAGVYEEKEIDPFSGAFVPGFTSVVYSIRMVFAEWQVSRYKAEKDKKKMLELRLLYLKMKQEKKEDPKIQQEIEYIQSRIDRIQRYMNEVEEDIKERG